MEVNSGIYSTELPLKYYSCFKRLPRKLCKYRQTDYSTVLAADYISLCLPGWVSARVVTWSELARDAQACFGAKPRFGAKVVTCCYLVGSDNRACPVNAILGGKNSDRFIRDLGIVLPGPRSYSWAGGCNGAKLTFDVFNRHTAISAKRASPGLCYQPLRRMAEGVWE